MLASLEQELSRDLESIRFSYTSFLLFSETRTLWRIRLGATTKLT